MVVRLREKSKKKKGWRCLICQRLLGSLIGESFLELETKNKQLIVVRYLQKEAICKCGVRTTVSGNMTILRIRA